MSEWQAFIVAPISLAAINTLTRNHTSVHVHEFIAQQVVKPCHADQVLITKVLTAPLAADVLGWCRIKRMLRAPRPPAT